MVFPEEAYGADSGEASERCLVADPARVRPRGVSDGGTDRADTGPLLRGRGLPGRDHRWTVATSRRCCSSQTARGSVGLATRTPTDREISSSVALPAPCGLRREGLVSMSDDASRLIGSVVEVVRVAQPDRTMSALVWGLATHGLDDVPGVALVRHREGLWQTSDRVAVVVVAAAGEVLLAEISPNPAWHCHAPGREPSGNPRRRHARTRRRSLGLDKAHGSEPFTALALSSTRRMNATAPPARPSRGSEIDKVPCTID